MERKTYVEQCRDEGHLEEGGEKEEEGVQVDRRQDKKEKLSSRRSDGDDEGRRERTEKQNLKKTRDSQHEVLLPAGQVAPDSNGCALHILYF